MFVHFRNAEAWFDYTELWIYTDGESLPTEVLESIDDVDGVVYRGKQLARIMANGAGVNLVSARIIALYDSQDGNRPTEIRHNGQLMYRRPDPSSGGLRLTKLRPQRAVGAAA